MGSTWDKSQQIIKERGGFLVEMTDGSNFYAYKLERGVNGVCEFYTTFSDEAKTLTVWSEVSSIKVEKLEADALSIPNPRFDTDITQYLARTDPSHS
jgi:hypothetical protein